MTKIVLNVLILFFLVNKVILFLAILAVGSARYRKHIRYPIHLPRRGDDIYAASLGGAPVGIYSRTGKWPGFFRRRESVYAASLGGAPVGMYTRYGRGGRRHGSDVYGASLGKAPVGMYSRE